MLVFILGNVWNIEELDPKERSSLDIIQQQQQQPSSLGWECPICSHEGGVGGGVHV